MEETDQLAVARVRQGDRDAYRILVDRYSRPVFRLAYRMTGNEHDAEDVVQEAFLRAYRQLHTFSAAAAFSTWLYRIAANYALDLIRARQRHATDSVEPELLAQEAAATGPLPDRLAMSSQVQRELDLALQSLTAQERTAFVLRHYEGQSIEEISRALGLRDNATKNSIFRAVQKLRRALEPLVAAAI